jgi:pyruvate/2-oxoglutarate dehydrogenase complex dihydrolipoamide acyltransferase (E2) component
MIGLNSNSFGTAGISSVGNFGFEDSTSPFNTPTNWTILLTVNAVTRRPVVEGGEVTIGNVMICNFMVDSRYISIENCSKLTSTFRNVFE